MHDAEAIPQRAGERAGPGGSTDQGKGGQIELDGAGRRPLPDHDVELVILHRRIEHLFHHRAEAVDLVDKEHIVWFEVGEQCSQITRFLQYGARGSLDIDPHLVGNDVGEGGLAQTRRAEDQQVIESLPPQPSRLDKDLHLLANGILTGIVRQFFGADGTVDNVVLAGGTGRNETICFNHLLPHTRLRRDSRMISSTDMSSLAILLTIWLACCGL